MPPVPTSEVVPYFASAILIMYVQQFLKTRETYAKIVKVLPGTDKWAHRLIAGVGALIAALGIGYVWDWSATEGGRLIISIPDLATLKHGLWDWLVVYGFQQYGYDTTRRPATMPHDQPVDS